MHSRPISRAASPFSVHPGVAVRGLFAVALAWTSSSVFAQATAVGQQWVGPWTSGFANLHLAADTRADGARKSIVPVLRQIVPVAATLQPEPERWLGLRSDGRVAAWGNNFTGICRPPLDLDRCVKVAAGHRHAFALRDDGTIVRWGDRVDDGYAMPVLSDVIDIASTGDWSYAVTADGVLHEWGGIGQWMPADVGSVARIKTKRHAGAIRTDGTLRCWGPNDAGQCDVPPSLGRVLDVALGERHSVVLRRDGSIVCFGANTGGACTVPTELGVAVEVAAGKDCSYALGTDGAVRRWGANQDETLVEVLRSVTQIEAWGSAVAGLGPDGRVRGRGWYWGVMPRFTGTLTSVTAGDNAYAGVDASGRVTLWGGIRPEQSLVPPDLGPITQAALGWSHAVARRVDGTVAAWGRIVLGIGQTGDAFVPSDLGTVLEVQSGPHRMGALRTDHRLVIWGYNGGGEGAVPDDVRIVERFAIAPVHNLAVLQGGTVRAWGGNNAGQSQVPAGLANAIGVAGGSLHSLALRADGAIVAWGNGAWGQTAVPPDLGPVSAIGAAALLSVALRVDGAVRVWGNPGAGVDSPGSPLAITKLIPRDLGTVRSISVGADALAIALDPCNRHVLRVTGNLGAVGATVPREVHLDGLPPARGDVRLSLEASADLGGINEFLTLALNGTALGDLFREGGHDCPLGIGLDLRDRETIVVSAAVFNALLRNGAATVRLEGSALVNADQCVEGGVARTVLELDYVAADSDCDASGVSDWCEISAGAIDADRDGRLDRCERRRGDLTLDGVVDADDIAQVLSEWGIAAGSAGDATGDGVVDARDLSFVLSSWGFVDWGN